MRQIKTFLKQEVVSNDETEKMTVEEFIKESVLNGEDCLSELNKMLVENDFQELKGMTGQDAVDLFRKLSQSQGFYGRLLQDVTEMTEEEFEDFDNAITERQFLNPVELILFIEC